MNVGCGPRTCFVAGEAVTFDVTVPETAGIAGASGDGASSMHYRVSHVCAEMAHVSRREFAFAESDHGGRKIHL